MLKPGSVPDRALTAIWACEAKVLYDARILEEYRRVLIRPKFKAIDPTRIEELLSRIEHLGEVVLAVAHWDGVMPDEDDRQFVEVAIAGGADAIITGNLRDYPADVGCAVHPPASLLAMLG